MWQKLFNNDLPLVRQGFIKCNCLGSKKGKTTGGGASKSSWNVAASVTRASFAPIMRSAVIQNQHGIYSYGMINVLLCLTAYHIVFIPVCGDQNNSILDLSFAHPTNGQEVFVIWSSAWVNRSFDKAPEVAVFCSAAHSDEMIRHSYGHSVTEQGSMCTEGSVVLFAFFKRKDNLLLASWQA